MHQQPHGNPPPPHPPLRAPPAQASTYASQAARWKKGFQAATSGSRQTDLEGALISELCSSIGTSSFPPREVLQKLLRYLPSLDLDVSRYSLKCFEFVGNICFSIYVNC
jgi:hypothetical protein